MPEEWLKTTEAAEISGYHPNHIRRLIRAGENCGSQMGFRFDDRPAISYGLSSESGSTRGKKRPETSGLTHFHNFIFML